jgi:hypothetical protein
MKTRIGRIGVAVPLVLLALAVALATEAGAREKWGPFQGQVVDVETEQPIAGAVILVTWWEVCGLFGQSCFVEAREAVTGADGRFRIARLTGFGWNLAIQPPQIDAFAPGYVPVAEIVTPVSGEIYVDPTVLQMRRLKTREEILKKSRGPSRLIPEGKMPQFLRAVESGYEMLGLGQRKGHAP